ncbi:Exonuclease sbcC [Cyanobacterium sp. HL-69]|uniref:hypothetical protein n=1 Tax=Cyanobacterium sp. HL-69 TaxID=2054282 RepID=UPI000CA23CD0|nr:Exonuclease sbcC [Cyanobacterium sp. HL-69]
MTRKKTRTGTGLGSSKSKVNITLSPEANETLVALAKETGLTKSKLFDQILVGGFVINSHSADTKVVLHDEGEQKFLVTEVDDNDKDSESDSGSLNNNAIEEEIKNHQAKIAELEQEINKQKDLVADKSKTNQDLETKLQAQQDKVGSIQKELEDKNNQIKNLEDNFKKVTQDSEKSDNSDQLKNLNQELNSAYNSIKNLENKQSELSSLVEEKEKYIRELTDKFFTLKEEVKNSDNNEQLSAIIDQLKKEIADYRQQVAHKEQEKVALSQSYATKQNSIIQGLTKENTQLKQENASLNKRIADLEPRANIGDRFLNKWR